MLFSIFILLQDKKESITRNAERMYKEKNAQAEEIKDRLLTEKQVRAIDYMLWQFSFSSRG